MSAPSKEKELMEWKDVLDEYFWGQSEGDKEEIEDQRLYLQYLNKQDEEEQIKKEEEAKRKQDAVAARAVKRAQASSKELDPADAWQWDGKANMARQLDKCLVSGEYIWKGRYKKLGSEGKWVAGMLDQCKATGKYVWAEKGSEILLGPQPRWYRNGPAEEPHICLPPCTT
ncbi:hypothetical protein BDP27DRAFT_1364779 [Rhodocollybia butyracea]|uniref:Uncharacterized protein n=1 Tax=Rhodocollybia butyracea TaxID=206335 RepID=A0A9P5U640_9AGAR|nr:hypothetical protein BDP27DRAFT_1364779 [Rhodocollybia butyracea]